MRNNDVKWSKAIAVTAVATASGSPWWWWRCERQYQCGVSKCGANAFCESFQRKFFQYLTSSTRQRGLLYHSPNFHRLCETRVFLVTFFNLMLNIVEIVWMKNFQLCSSCFFIVSFLFFFAVHFILFHFIKNGTRMHRTTMTANECRVGKIQQFFHKFQN